MVGKWWEHGGWLMGGKWLEIGWPILLESPAGLPNQGPSPASFQLWSLGSWENLAVLWELHLRRCVVNTQIAAQSIFLGVGAPVYHIHVLTTIPTIEHVVAISID